MPKKSFRALDTGSNRKHFIQTTTLVSSWTMQSIQINTLSNSYTSYRSVPWKYSTAEETMYCQMCWSEPFVIHRLQQNFPLLFLALLSMGRCDKYVFIFNSYVHRCIFYTVLGRMTQMIADLIIEELLLPFECCSTITPPSQASWSCFNFVPPCKPARRVHPISWLLSSTLVFMGHSEKHSLCTRNVAERLGGYAHETV